MSSQNTHSLDDYSNGTKNVCMCTIVSIVLILAFIISPLKNFVIASMFGKIIILSILTFALYKNISITFYFSKQNNFLEGDWSNTKTNIIGSYVFSIFLLILILSVFKKLF